jgi:murein DD-endopeptidase MepM/ murein hydrolase activator NlpD
VLRGLLLVLAGVLVGANLVYFAMTRDRGARAVDAVQAPVVVSTTGPSGATRTTTEPASGGTQGSAPQRAPVRPAPPPPAARTPAATPMTPAAPLAMPLPGLRPAQLQDTYDDPRGDARRHEALDLMAPAGTPVLAVADGHVEKLFDSDQGGLTIYQFEPTGHYAYYYAHLQRYAPGLAEKQAVKRGEVIGYVGSTGNADPAAPHLHFAVFVLGPERQWWKGTPINPYPLLGGRPAAPAVPAGQASAAAATGVTDDTP